MRSRAPCTCTPGPRQVSKTRSRSGPRSPVGHVPALHVEAEARTLPEQRTAAERQEELRHEVFEHSPRPAGQAAIAVPAHEGAGELAPVPRGHVPVRDGIIARQTRLAGQQVVAALAGAPRPRVKAYAEEPARPVVERGKVHAVTHFQGLRGQVGATVFPQPGGEGR